MVLLLSLTSVTVLVYSFSQASLVYLMGVFLMVLTVARAASSLQSLGKQVWSCGVISSSMFDRSLALAYSCTVLSLVFVSMSPWGVILPMYSPVTFTGHFLPGTRVLVAL